MGIKPGTLCVGSLTVLFETVGAGSDPEALSFPFFVSVLERMCLNLQFFLKQHSYRCC